MLVTGDIKEDWWTPRTNQSPARPRSELQNELRNQSGVALFMLTPSQLLAEVSTAFKLEVDKRSVNDLASREGNVEIFPAPIRSAIVGSILSAHERAREVHKVSGLSSMSPYGATVVVAVREELNERIAAIGGTTISVRGADYPVFDGFLFLPFRTPSGAPAATLSKSPRIRAVQELIEPSEEMFDFGDEPNRNLTPVIISYSTTADSGVESILAGLGHFAGAGKFDFHFQSRLL